MGMLGPQARSGGITNGKFGKQLQFVLIPNTNDSLKLRSGKLALVLCCSL